MEIPSLNKSLSHRPLYVFFFNFGQVREIRRHHWKERLEISEIAKFESDLLKTNKDITPHIHDILQTFYRHKVEGTNFLPPYKPSVNFRNFGERYIS